MPSVIGVTVSAPLAFAEISCTQLTVAGAATQLSPQADYVYITLGPIEFYPATAFGFPLNVGALNTFTLG